MASLKKNSLYIDWSKKISRFFCCHLIQNLNLNLNDKWLSPTWRKPVWFPQRILPNVRTFGNVVQHLRDACFEVHSSFLIPKNYSKIFTPPDLVMKRLVNVLILNHFCN
jgi:hypothetical protein